MTQFQEWMKRQNGDAVMSNGPSVEEQDSPDKMSKAFSFENPAFFDDSEYVAT